MNRRLRVARKNKYIPHLAEFYFEPDLDWTPEECGKLYEANGKDYYNTIIYSDCIKGMARMPANSVDLVVADPPFGIGFTGKESIYNRKAENVEEGYLEVENSYGVFSERWICRLPRIMKPEASAYIISGWTNIGDILNAIKKAKLKIINHIIWKYQFGVFTKRKFVTSHYHILFVVKNPKKYFFNRIEHYNEDVWHIPRKYMPKQKKNGTKLPVKLIEKMIDFSSKPGDLVFDPFMGNGTTAVAAKANWRHFFGFEINEKMKPIIEHALNQVSLGQHYIPYNERLKSPEELARINKDYEKAYREYLKREKLEVLT